MTIDNSMIIGRPRAGIAAITSMWLDLKADNAGLKARSHKCEADRNYFWGALADLQGNCELVQRRPAPGLSAARTHH